MVRHMNLSSLLTVTSMIRSEVNKAYLTKIIRISHGYVLYATKFKHFRS